MRPYARPSRGPRRERLRRPRDPAAGAGDHGAGRLVPHATDDRVRHEGRGRRDTREGRAAVRRRRPRVRYRRGCRAETRANATVIYVPAALAASAMYEAADAVM